MKKNKQTMVFLLTFCWFIFRCGIDLAAQEFITDREYLSHPGKILITKDTFTFKNSLDGSRPDKIIIENYGLGSIYKIPFIFNSSGCKEILFLYDSDIAFCYYEEDDKVLFHGILTDKFVRGGLDTPGDIEVSSYLTEGNMVYDAKNLMRKRLDAPWVEGVPGHGIGETISFTMGEGYHGIYIFNGFISFHRPDLYLKNSRVKKLLVRVLGTDIEFSVTLEDTPHPQLIKVPGGQGHKVELVIQEVYPGTKYTDTCVAGISLKRFE